ncbi:MAG: glycosyltransferase family 4 protein [Acidimicrobiales bacterium]|nr:glycosyltransferase family 4 protein [Acidimicrobiales bacterium]
MSVRRALVVHTRMPAFDRDSGSQDVDNTIRFLLDAGWDVTFLAREEEGVAEERHAARLRRMGVSTYAGFGWADKILRSGNFDLAVIAFWELAERIIPIVREHSRRTRIVVNSMDVHFLRNARSSFGRRSNLESSFGAEASRELNTYNAADAIIAVSEKEQQLLGDFLGHDRVFTLPLAEQVPRSPVPLAERRGMFFVGNFRHVPNREAAQFLCNEVVPLLDRDLLDEHPVSIIGNWLTQAKLPIDDTVPGVHLVGWVPSMQPYLHRSRIALVPLLHGAGVKRKVIQALMARTPVVTTPVGAEGLDLVQGEHALIAADAGDMAAGITRLLSDDALWERLVASGADHVDARHSLELVESQFADDRGCRRAPPFAGDGPWASSSSAEDQATTTEVAAAHPERRRARGHRAGRLGRRRRVRRRGLADVLALPAGARRRLGRLRPGRRPSRDHAPGGAAHWRAPGGSSCPAPSSRGATASRSCRRTSRSATGGSTTTSTCSSTTSTSWVPGPCSTRHRRPRSRSSAPIRRRAPGRRPR